MTTYRTARVYDDPSPDDGVRVLVDRLWPRGLSKERADIDVWPKEVAPSTDLRRWFHAHSDEEAEFAQRYRTELEDVGLDALRGLGDVVTLLTASRDGAHVRVLLDLL